MPTCRSASLLGLALAAPLGAQHSDPTPDGVAPGEVLVPSATPAPGFHYELRAQNALKILDLNGREVRTWGRPQPGWVFAELAKPLSYGSVLAIAVDPTTSGLGTHKKVVEVDWSGNLVWEFDPFLLGRKPHHDFQRLPNGNTIIVTDEITTIPYLGPEWVRDDVVMEVDVAGNVVWEWSSIAHMPQMPISAAGWASRRGGSPPYTFFHMNSVQVLPPNKWASVDPRFAPGNVMVSYRELNLVAIIDRASGDIVWYLHNQTVGQHHPRMIAQDLRGAGNILIFDNGGNAGAPRGPYRPFSRVIEINPVTGQTVWSYQCSSASSCRPEFFAPFTSGAQRLTNGNTLITDSQTGRIFEVDTAGAVIWERIQSGWVYRGYRFDLRWPSGPISFGW